MNTSYSFDLDQSKEDELSPYRNNLQRVKELRYKGELYRYGVVPQGLHPSIPHFIGMPKGNNLFASDSMSPELLLHSLQHEIECNYLQVQNGDHRCRNIEWNLLESLGEPLQSQIISARHAMFQALLCAYKIDPAKSPKKKSLQRRIFLTSSLLAQQEAANELSVKLGTTREKLIETLMQLMMNKRMTDITTAIDSLSEPLREQAKKILWWAGSHW